MEIKFKVGDVVKIVTSALDGPLLRREGNIVTILGITKAGKYKIDQSKAEYEECELVLVKGA